MLLSVYCENICPTDTNMKPRQFNAVDQPHKPSGFEDTNGFKGRRKPPDVFVCKGYDDCTHGFSSVDFSI